MKLISDIKFKIGITLIVASIIAGLTNAFSPIIHQMLAKLYCGDNYLQPVDGLMGDLSCGFNSDMYFIVLLAVSFLIAVVLIFTSISRNKRNK